MIHNAEDHVTLIGRLGSAPDFKPLANGRMLILNLGVQVLSFTVDQAGERQSSERTSWHRVISLSPRVIRRAHGLETNDTIAVGGYLDQRTYEKDGQQLYITEFVAEELDPIRTKRLPSAVPNPPSANQRNVKSADMLRITVELLPRGREAGAIVISRGALPISNLADLAKVIDSG